MTRRPRSHALLAVLAIALASLTVVPGVAAASPADHLEVTTSLSGNAVAGVPFDITVTALDGSEAVVTDYDGTVSFSGGGAGAILPVDYTFQATDNGTHPFTNGVTLTEAGLQTIDVDDGTATGQVQVTVDPGPADHLRFDAQPTDTFTNELIEADPSGPVTVRIEDEFGNLLTGDDSTSVDVALGSGDFTSGSITTATATGGIASFASLSPEPSAESATQTLVATSDGLSGDTSSTFAVLPSADLTIVKSGPATEYAGNAVGYSLTVTNNGPSTAAAPSVEDTFDANVENPRYCVGAPCADEGDFTDYTGPFALGDLAAAGIVDVAIRADIPPSEAKDTILENTATVSSTTHDPNETNNTSGPVETTVDTAADLGVTVTPEPDGSSGNDVVAGNNQVFHVDVANGGPSDGGTYTLSLHVEGLDGGSTTLVSAPVGCSAVTGDTIECARAGIPAEGSDQFDVTVHIASGYANPDNSASLAYDATISDQEVQDLDDANDGTGAQLLTVVRKADLGIEVTNEQVDPIAGHDAVAGTDQVFHMTVNNAGPSDNGDYTATLTVDDYDGTDLTLVSAPGCTGTPGSPGTVECASPGTLSAEDTDPTDTFDITFHISPSYTNPSTIKNLAHSAALSGLDPSDQGDDTEPDSTGPLAVQVDAVSDLTDIAVEQSAEETTVTTFVPATPGNLNSVIYTVTVTNTGPSDAQSVSLTETIPSARLETGANKIKYCVTSLATCTPTTPFYTNGTSLGLGALALNETKLIRFEAPLKIGERRGSAANLMAGDATAVVTTSTDPNPANDTTEVDINLFTVPDAPTLLLAQPGNGEIGLLWKVPADGGSPITGWDVFLDGTPTFVPVTSPSLGNGFCAPDTCKTIQIAAPNGSHTVKIQARNAAGDSSPSATFTVVPCASCVIDQLTNTRTFLLSSNNASRVITPATPGFSSWFTNGCFPQSNSSSQPGATSSDTKVSCLDIPAGVASSKVGALVALHDEQSVTGDCPNPDGKHPCLGNQTVVSIPPGTGSDETFTQVLIYDRLISTKINGDPCTASPCGKKYAYIVYMRPDSTSPAVPIGSTARNGVTLGTGASATTFPAWCPTVGGEPQIPTGKIGCVVSYVLVAGNSKPNPDPNGNSSNGSEGNGDLRLTILFRGDPRTAP